MGTYNVERAIFINILIKALGNDQLDRKALYTKIKETGYSVLLNLVDEIIDPYKKALCIKRMIATCSYFIDANALLKFKASKLKEELVKRQFDLSKLI